MNPTSPTSPARGHDAPRVRLGHDTAIYLANLAHAVKLATYEETAAEMAYEHRLVYEPYSGRDFLRLPGGPRAAASLPGDIVQASIDQAAGQRVLAARRTRAFAAAWYATAAGVALRAMLAGDDLAPCALEAATLTRPDRPRDPAQDAAAPPWGAHNRPDLADADLLRTGVAMLDAQVELATRHTAGVYDSARAAESLHGVRLSRGLTDTERQTLNLAERNAAQLPDALTALGDAYREAATRGHRVDGGTARPGDLPDDPSREPRPTGGERT